VTQDQTLILALLGVMVAALLWGRFRHDVVALAALLAAVLAGLVPADAAFAGFGHPAVITVACVLILSQALQHTGAVDWLARAALPAQAGRTASLAALMGLGAGLSAFMNNVGAMALLMPVAVQTAARLGLPPGRVLMPLAFGTILGGMTTLVGTPPNLIVAGFRPGEPFQMFDFAWVGLPVALAGIALVLLGGWRLVPDRRPPATEGFATGSYLTELVAPEGAAALGQTLRAVEDRLDPAEGRIVALVRDGQRRDAPSRRIELRAGDVLLLEAQADGLAEALAATGLKLNADRKTTPEPDVPEGDGAEGASGDGGESEIWLAEYAILPGASLAGRTARDLHLRRRLGLNLLAVSRAGRRPQARLRTLALKPGDVILLQGPAEALADFAATHGLAPLAPRALRLPDRGRALLAGAAMAGAVGLAAAGVVPAAVAFALGVLAVMALRLLPLRQVYDAIDWPVIVLLAALIPVAGAMETTGAARHLAEGLVVRVAPGMPLAALALVLVVTMFLSDVMNNAATAAVMAPVALAIAQALGVSPDPLLMAVAIGASCAFLTPIGHQNNTLILGPGGFGFGDYWRLGLPLEAVVVLVAVPLLPLAFPF
jgi:di/tricarboxylate transporter